MKNFIFLFLLVNLSASILWAQPVATEVTSIEQSETAPLAESRLFETIDLLMNELPAPGGALSESKRMRHTWMRDDLLLRYSGVFPERFQGTLFQPEDVPVSKDQVGGPAVRFFTNGIAKDFPGEGFVLDERVEVQDEVSSNDIEIFNYKFTLMGEDALSVARDPSGWQGCGYELRFHPRLLRYFLFRETCYKTLVNEKDGTVTRKKANRYARWAYMFEAPEAARVSQENLDEYHERKWQSVATADTLRCPGGEKSGGKLRLHCSWYEDFSSKEYESKLLDAESKPATEAMLCEAPKGGFKCGFFQRCPYRLMWRAKRFDPYQTWSSDFIEAKDLQPSQGLNLKSKNWKLGFSLNPLSADQTHALGNISVPKNTRQLSGTQKLRCRWVD